MTSFQDMLGFARDSDPENSSSVFKIRRDETHQTINVKPTTMTNYASCMPKSRIWAATYMPSSVDNLPTEYSSS